MSATHDSNDSGALAARGFAGHPGASSTERRERLDRRRRVLWSVVYGSFNPRRRNPSRRTRDTRYQSVDWHASHLLLIAISILLLSVCDAFLTLRLLTDGAEEANPVMAALLERNSAAFAVMKMSMTGFSVVLMVFLARYRFMRLVRVELALYATLLAYVALVGYEVYLLKTAGLDGLY